MGGSLGHRPERAPEHTGSPVISTRMPFPSRRDHAGPPAALGLNVFSGSRALAEWLAYAGEARRG
jgi:hypothetical protein